MRMSTGNFVRIVAVLVTVAMSAAVTAAATAQSYDVVILNGRVMDPETKFDAVRNVGIKDGRIAKITEEKITGKETINAKGHVVAPGFIDTHTHSSDIRFSKTCDFRIYKSRHWMDIRTSTRTD